MSYYESGHLKRLLNLERPGLFFRKINTLCELVTIN